MSAAHEQQVETALATPLDAAEYLNLSRSTVYEMLNSGELPSIRIRRARRIRWSDLERLVQTGEC